MHARRGLPVVVTALLSAALVLAGPQPAGAAEPRIGSQTHVYRAVPCAAVPAARWVAAGCHGAAGYVRLSGSGGVQPNAPGPKEDPTMREFCQNRLGEWWATRFDACEKYLIDTTFVNLSNGRRVGDAWSTVEYVVDTDPITTDYQVEVDVAPFAELTWGVGLDSEYDVTGWCAGACELTSVEQDGPWWWGDPSAGTWNYVGLLNAPGSVVTTGAEIDISVTAPGASSSLFQDSWGDKIRCDNVNRYNGCVFPWGDALLDYSLYSTNYPAVIAHIAQAQAAGQPGAPGHAALHRTTDELRINNNTNAACPRSLPRPPGMDCDEYPFKTTQEGGAAASHAMVPLGENRGAGAILQSQLYNAQHVLDGDAFHVNVDSGGGFFAPIRVGDGGGGGGGGGGGPTGEPDLTGDGVADLLSQFNGGDMYAYPGSGGIANTVTSSTFGSDTDIGSWAGHTEYALGDINGDGRPDLLSQTANGDMYAYPGSGSINASTTFWSGTRIGNWAGHPRFALGDLNGDGRADLLTQYYNGDLYVYPGSGHINTTTTFWSGTDIGSWAGHTSIALGDLNGDGRADLLTQYYNGDLYVYPGSGHVNTTTTFWSGTDIGSWAGHVNVDLADFNGDGHPDLLSQTAAGTYYAYPGSGHINTTTTFWSGTQLDTVDVLNYGLGDLNGDHRADLLSQTTDGHLHAFAGSGHITATQTSNSTLLAGTDIGSWAGHSDMARGDLNGDGLDDLLTQTANGNVYVYPGSGHINSSTTFWSGTMIGNWAGHTNLTLGDLNGDGLPDLLTQYANGDLYVYPGSGHINSSTTFWSGTRIGNWSGHDHLVLGDLNGDGIADLLTQYYTGDLYAYPGSGHIDSSTTFWSGTDIGSWAGHVDLALGDLNRDGFDDLVSMTAGGDLYVYPGSGHINTTTTFWSGKWLGSWAGHSNITL